MKVLVTGAAGFIGSHLSKKLEEEGEELVLVDNFERGKQENLDNLGVKTKCQHGDLRSYETANKVTKGIDLVYHLAARIGGMQFLHGTEQKELDALHENLLIDTNLFRACNKNNVKQIIYASSISVYNIDAQYESQHAIFNEESLARMELKPEGGYGWAKYIGEQNLEMMCKTGVNIGILRIFKCYGPGDNISKKSSNVIIAISKRAIDYPKQDFVVWGEGTATRDFFYIDDCVNAFIKTQRYLRNHKKCIVNVGSGNPTSIREITEKIVSISGKDINIRYDRDKPVGPLSRTADITKIKTMLNWTAKTNLNAGLKKTYTWLQKVY